MILPVRFGYLICWWALVNLWHSSTLALRAECQSAHISEIKNV